MKTTAIYARVSTQEQAKEGYSIDEQISRLKSYCEAMNWNNYKTYIDAGASGGNTNRPALQELIGDIRCGKIDKVVVYKLDRLSRSQKDTLNLIEDTFLASGVDFVSISENFDTSTPFGRAMVGILAVFAQLEREQIKERMNMGRAARAKEGKWIGVGNKPIGYDYIDGELVINNFEALQVKELFNLYNAGYSPRKIARIFSDKGYKTRYGKWYERRIITTLQNKLYAGFVSFDGESFKGIHEPIITQEDFDKAQSEFEARKRTDVVSPRNSTYLGGLLYCKQCGARYGIYGSGQYRYYSCHSRRKRNAAMIRDPNCKNKTYRVDYLDSVIFEEIRKLRTEPEAIAKMQASNVSEMQIEKAETIQHEIDKLIRQRKRYLELYGIESISSEELQELIEPLNSQIDKLNNEKSQLAGSRPALSEDNACRLVADFCDIIDGGSHDEIRQIIEALINRIEVDEDAIEIHWRFC